MSRVRQFVAVRLAALTLPLVTALSGCVAVPSAAEYRNSSAVLAAPHGAQPALDGRARFRQIFCQVAQQSGSADDPQCESMLWRLKDETAVAATQPLPPVRTDLRLVIVPGALNDCFGPDAQPFADGIESLKSLGVQVDYAPVSGRSSSAYNARQLADFLGAPTFHDGDRIVMLGYSKGAVDIVEFLSDYPELAARIAGIVSVAGPMWGSPLADSGDWFYRHVMSHTYTKRCTPGDSGLVHSLRPDVRAQWQQEHPLPAGIPFYFVGAFTTSEHLARGLRPTWRSLAKTEKRNDGQVRIDDEVQPGATLLGYANADHWGVALTVERELNFLAKRKEPNDFPQQALLQAIWLFLGEDRK
jgi:hypothetical protein